MNELAGLLRELIEEVRGLRGQVAAMTALERQEESYGLADLYEGMRQRQRDLCGRDGVTLETLQAAISQGDGVSLAVEVRRLGRGLAEVRDAVTRMAAGFG